jgi:glycerophosphoryl diester phosphodiesterase
MEWGSNMVIQRHLVVALVAVMSLAVLPTTGRADPPSPASEPDLQVPPLDPREIPVANVGHRGSWGGPGEPPENTLASYALAVAQGAHVIETDATMTADGHVVAYHDRSLTGKTDVQEVFPGRDSYRVVDMTLAELGQLTVGSWDEPQGIPTLEEVIALARSAGVGLLIDMKPDHSAGIVPLEPAVVEVLRGLGDPDWVDDRVMIGGFFHPSLQDTLGLLADRGLHPEAAFIVNFVISVGGTVAAANPTTPGLVAPGMTLTQVRDALAAAGFGYFGLGLLSVTGAPVNDFTAAEVDHFRAGGIELNFFTNDPGEMISFVERGVSSILTDHPDRLSALLRPELRVDGEPNAGPFVRTSLLEAAASPGIASEEVSLRYWRLGHRAGWEAWPADGLNLRPGRHDLLVSAIDEHGYESRQRVEVVMQPSGPSVRR